MPVQNLFKEIISDVDGVLLFSPTKTTYEKWQKIIDTVVVAVEDTFDEGHFIEIPIEIQDPVELFQFGISGALDAGFIEEDASVICASKFFERDFDSVTCINVHQIMKSDFYDFFTHSRAKSSAIKSILKLAIELGKGGQKGKPVGALFSIGDAGTVMSSSRSLSYNPFDQSHVHVGDPIVSVMLKEFSRLDGAFVLSDAGKIVSSYQYLEPSIDELDIPKGLGTRHHAAAAITNETDAVTIVLSESDNRVRGFKNGNLIFNIDPERY